MSLGRRLVALGALMSGTVVAQCFNEKGAYIVGFFVGSISFAAYLMATERQK